MASRSLKSDTYIALGGDKRVPKFTIKIELYKCEKQENNTIHNKLITKVKYLVTSKDDAILNFTKDAIVLISEELGKQTLLAI